MTRQNCRNIVRKFKDFSNHRHVDDAISVDRIVRELRLEHPSPVIAYKPQGIDVPDLALPLDTFFLCIMTEFQAQLFDEFSSAIVCLDSTHCTNQYRYKLITLMVVDDFHNGCPVVWLISNREDEVTLTVFFQQVKQRCPCAVINALMTDDDLAGVNGCRHIYPDVVHLLCKWHVDRAWQRKLHALVNDQKQRAEMYACLCMLMNEEDSAIFYENQDVFLEYWREKQPKFIQYYEAEYVPRTAHWALCYRHFDHASTDTNMFVESFHNKLKTNPRYLAHHVNRRVDDLVAVLLTIEEDIFHERMRKEVMCDSHDASLKCEGSNRHQKGNAIPDTAVKVIDQHSYAVMSADGTSSSTVVIHSHNCNSANKPCALHCTALECHCLCRCMMECSCIDFKHGHICKHMHKVRLLTLPDADPGNDNDAINKGFIPSDLRTTKCKAADITGRKNEIKKHVQSISSSVEETNDQDVLDHVLSLLTQTSASLNAVSPHSSAQDENQMQPFEVKEKFSPTQTHERQLKLWKTCKSPGRKPQNALVKPQGDEYKQLWSAIMNHPPEINKTTSSEHGECIDISRSSATGKRKTRCGQCEGCTMDSCGVCVNCRDMTKYGGPGKKKQACKRRACTRTQHAGRLQDVSNIIN
jgi:hypothetical protein